MPILDIFKKKEPEKKPKKKPEKKTEAKAPAKRKEPGRISLLLEQPHVTEKAVDLNKENKYVFKVSSKANKNRVKRAVESSYNVDVESVNIVNMPRKKRRLGRQEGWRKGYKKAIVKIKKGQSIEILPR